MLKIENLIFSYIKDPLLKGINLHVKPNSVVAIVGPSGSGKSTLFKLIAGYFEQQEGVIALKEESHPTQRRESIAYMTQEDLLLPWKNVFQNLSMIFSLKSFQLFKKACNKEKIIQILDEVGLKGFEFYLPRHLSGGMRQRVSLARSLLFQRSLLLLDEPFGALDVNNKKQMYELLKKLKTKNQLTILFITHDLEDARVLADECYQLENGILKKIQ